MKRAITLAVALLTMIGAAHAGWWWDNYAPDNVNVHLTSTNLPIVWIDVDGNYIDIEERITARMKIIHNGNGKLNYADTIAHPGQTVDYKGYVALRYRGNSSFTMSAKKPYSFRPLDKPLEDGGTKQKVNILGMGKDNNWALLAPYADKSMMRDLLAFEVSRPWMEYTPEGRFCELFLDGIYYGVYIMCEVVSQGKNRLNLPDPGIEGEEMSGGYLMEVDRDDEINYISKYHPVSNNGTIYQNQYIHFQYKFPDYEDLTAEQIRYINIQIDKMERALWNYQVGQARSFLNFLDETNFIDYQIVMELSHNVDGYRLSGKFFKRRDSEDPRFKMVVWDLNIAFGNAAYYQGSRTDNWIYTTNNLLNSEGDPQLVPFWWYKLNNDPTYTEGFKKRWALYRRTNLRKDRFMAKIDSLANVLTVNGAEQRNSQAWPRWGEYVWPNYYIATNFDDEINYLKTWITRRIQWMDEQLGFDPNASVRGDVNIDGKVTIDDVTTLIDYLLNGPTSIIDLDAADCDENGRPGISDVPYLIDYLLNGQWPG